MSPSQPSLLYQLQNLDLGIAQRQNRLTEIERTIGANPEVVKATQRLDVANKELNPWQVRSRDLDLEIQSLTQKAKTAEQSLYGGNIKNPKELTDLQNEIESLKRHQSQLEDALLDAMAHVEEGQGSIASAQAALDTAKANWAGSQVDLLDEQNRLEPELSDLRTRRKELAARIEGPALSTYEALRPKKRGQAVALLDGDSCKTCGVEQTSMIAQQVRQGTQIVICASCGRILTLP
jgi:predicted  nucleic acid-binding Zn-ribbon protein